MRLIVYEAIVRKILSSPITELVQVVGKVNLPRLQIQAVFGL